MTHPPPTDWNSLYTMSKAELRALGCVCWDGRLMLFPGNWYEHVPDALVVETINDKAAPFGDVKKGVKGGVLACGIPAIDGIRTPEEDD